ncbi:PAS domain S-box protein [Williamwhitmania taraxaci]|uniref:histidine kinase n=1 Tax=Williamwhitmania taraxaci TaxID=1640674 RepID=A0A1G6T4Z1_9BACT|nr:PAS domain S-box protein [Williamwhitmania taraxaci]SDD24128.1 PAS domain S-box-containing protein [Williamwhitmania taraxaci]
MAFSGLSKEDLQNQVERLQKELDATKLSYTNDLAEMEEVQSALVERERNFREIFNSSSDAIFIHNSQTGKIVDVNDTMLHLYGYSDKLDVLACNMGDLSDEEAGYTNERAQIMIQRTLTSKSKTFEWKARRKSGETFWVEATLQPTTIGGVRRIMATVHDLTTLYSHREALHSIESKYKNLYLMLRMMCDNVEDMLWAKDLNNCYIFANKSMCEKLFNAEDTKEPVGKNDMFFAERERERHLDNPEWHTFGEICRDTDSIVLENKRTERFDEYGNVKGEFLFLDVYKSPFYDEQGNIIGTVGSGRDVTHEKVLEKEFEHMQELVVASEEKYRQLAEMASDIIAMTSLSGKVTYMNPAGLTLVGLSNEESVHKSLFDLIPEEYHQKIQDGIYERMSGALEPHLYDVEIIDASGRRVPLEVNSSPIIVNDKVMGMITISRDVSERKRAAEALLQSEEKFRNLFDSMPNGYYRSTAQGSFLDVNPAFIKMLDYDSREELLAVDIPTELYVKPSDREDIITENKNFTSTDETYQLKTKSGRIIWVEDSARYIKDDAGNVLFCEGICRDITERVEAVEQLRKSEERFRTLVESFPDPIVVYIEGVIVFINEAGLKFLRASTPDQVVGRPVLDFVHPDSVVHSKARIAMVAKDRKSSLLAEEKFLRMDGSVANVEIVTIPTLYDGKQAVATIAHDITARLQAQEQIIKLTKGIEQSPVSVLITDINGIIEYVNPHFCKVSGYSAEEAIGKKPNILKSNDNVSTDYKELWETILAGNDWCGEFYNKSKNGDGYWEFASISPIKNSKGEITHVIAVKEDITERKHAELRLQEQTEAIQVQNEEYLEINEELIQTNAALHLAKEHAEESDRLKSAFLSNMSHEIRTPMNAIMGFSKLLCEREIDSESRMEYAQIITNSGIRLLNTVNDVLDISKIQAGLMVVNKQEFYLEKVFKELFVLYRNNFMTNSVEFTYQLDVALEQSPIYSDEQKVYQILNNLLSNSIKFTPAGSVVLGSRVSGDSVEFYVSDTGVGISRDHQELIFERFTQENMTYSRGHEGTGLGLAICKGLVSLLGGEIYLESEKGKGSTFIVSLPFYPVRDLTVKDIATSPPISTLSLEIAATILVAEDDDFSFLLAQKILSANSKLVVLRARNGREAVSICQGNPAIALVFMDVKMPIMDGYEAARRIKEINPKIPIVALTAYALSGDREQALNAGCNDYLAKPYSDDELLQMVAKFIVKK